MAVLLRVRLGLEEDVLFAAAWDGEVAVAHEWILEHAPEHIDNPDRIIEKLMRE